MPHDPRSRIADIDPAFEEFAAREPFFAVITDPAYRSDRITAEARRRFFASGEAIVESMFRTVALHLDSHFAPTAILEYGCGVGRLALPLAARSERRGGTLTAVDRSPAMLSHTRAHADAAGVGNITFAGPSDVFRRDSLPCFDLVACYLVLQRLVPADGLALIRALLATMLPGAIGVFQFPIASRVSMPISALRRVRESSPAVNRLVQSVRGESVRGPFVPSHSYALNDIAGVFRDAHLTATHLVFDDHGDLASVMAFVTAPETVRRAGDEALQRDGDTTTTAGDAAAIDVRDVIASTPIETLNEAAEQYFATLAGWDHHLAKPFASADEAPALLTDVAIVLRELDLRPGLTVLDFGAGTGWLSRALTQLGCSVIALDVSKTALAMARALYERAPVVGLRPIPRFLHFDGLRIDLPDASVDRVVCFHAFHHTPNPDAIVAEFGRILRVGGIAAFAEPGANHSRSAKSQFEMRSYRVIENDVDVHHIWEVAREHGFTDIRMAAMNGEPLELSLPEYDDLCRGGRTGDVWSRETRRYLRNVSNFKLVKQAAGRLDSSTAHGLACVIHARSPEADGRAGVPTEIVLRVTNTGSARWLVPASGTGGVSVGVRAFDARGSLLFAHVSGQPLTDPPVEIAPGAGVDCRVVVPALPSGQFELELDCVAADVTWFAQAGSQPARVKLTVR